MTDAGLADGPVEISAQSGDIDGTVVDDGGSSVSDDGASPNGDPTG